LKLPVIVSSTVQCFGF